MAPEPAQGVRGLTAPEQQFIVVASAGESLVVGGPGQSADLLFVGLQTGGGLGGTPDVLGHDGSVPAAGGEGGAAVPGEDPDPAGMLGHLPDHLLLDPVEDLDLAFRAADSQ